MAIFFAHDFTDDGIASGTLLETIQPETGQAWLKHGNSSADLAYFDDAGVNRIHATSSTFYPFYVAEHTALNPPAGPDYEVEARVRWKSLHDEFGLCIGIQGPGAGNQGRYMLAVSNSGTVTLRWIANNGTASVLSAGWTTPSGDKPAVAKVDTLRFQRTVVGTDVTLRGWWNGVEMGAPYVDSGAGSLKVAVGYAGLMSRARSNSLGPHVELFSAADVVVGGSPTIALTSPNKANITIPEGTRIQVTFSASDPEDGDLTASATVTSALHGPVGVGSGVIIDTTGRSGEQDTITIAVQDSASNPASVSFNLTVGAASSGGDTTLIRRGDMPRILQSGVAATVQVPHTDRSGNRLLANMLAPGDVTISVDGQAPTVLNADAGAATWALVNGYLQIPLSGPEVTGEEITILVEDRDGTDFHPETLILPVLPWNVRTEPADPAQVRVEMDTNSVKFGEILALVASRLADADYDAPDNATIAAIMILLGIVDGKIDVETQLVDSINDRVTAQDNTLAALPAAVLTQSEGVDGMTLARSMRLLRAVLTGPSSGAETGKAGTLVYKNPAGTKTRVTQPVDQHGNRATAAVVDLD